MSQKHFAIEINKKNPAGIPVPRRYWSGSGPLQFEGQTFEGQFRDAPDGTRTSLISLTSPENVPGVVGRRCRFVVAITDETLRREFSQDIGPASCRVWWIYPSVTSSAGDLQQIFDHEVAAGTERSAFELDISTDIIFTDAANGSWRVPAGPSTVSGNTGPGANNTRHFVFYEGSSPGTVNSPSKSVFSIDGGTAGRTEIQQWLASDNERRITVTVNLQGSVFRQANNGLYLWSSPTDPGFVAGPNQQLDNQVRTLFAPGHVNGWVFNDSYTAGQQVTDYAGNTFNISHNGGWREFTFNVPAGARYVGLAVDTSQPLPPGASSWQSDVAIADITLSERVPTMETTWAVIDRLKGKLSAPVISFENMTYSADIESLSGRGKRGRAKYWSNAQQQSDYPAAQNPGGNDDLCFENLEAIRRGEVKIRWY